MSNSSIRNPGSLVGSPDVGALSRFILSPIKRIAFWVAVVLPFLHVSLLTTGLDSNSTIMAFALLVTLNVCALVVGHPHGS